MKIDIEGLKRSLTSSVSNLNKKADEAQSMAQHLDGFDLESTGLQGEAYMVVNNKIRNHALYARTQALFMQTLSAGSSTNLKAAQALEPSERDGSVDTGRLSGARGLALHERDVWKGRGDNSFATLLGDSVLGRAWKNMCESIAGTKGREAREYERKIDLAETYARKSTTFYTQASSLKAALTSMERSQEATARGKAEDMSWVNELANTSAKIRQKLTSFYLKGKELDVYRKAMEDGKITADELYDSRSHKPNLTLLKALAHLPSALIDQNTLSATCDAFTVMGTDPGLDARQRARNLQAVLASQLTKVGSGEDKYTQWVRVQPSEPGSGQDPLLPLPSKWPWDEYTPSAFMGRVSDFMNKRDSSGKTVDGRKLRLDELAMDSVWTQGYQLVQKGIRVNQGDKPSFGVEIISNNPNNNKYGKNDARGVIVGINGVKGESEQNALNEVSYDPPVIRSSSMRLVGNPYDCYMMAADLANPLPTKPSFGKVLTGEVTEEVLGDLRDKALELAKAPGVVGIVLDGVDTLTEALEEYDKSLQEYTEQVEANDLSSMAGVVSDYSMLNDAHLNVEAESKEDMGQPTRMKWSMDSSMLSHYLNEYNKFHKTTYTARWFLGQLNSKGLIVHGKINPQIKGILDWGQAPATVRDAHTGKVFKDQQYLSRWDFVRQSQDPASPYFGWELVK